MPHVSPKYGSVPGRGGHHPVVVVGGGLVGLTLALDLAQQGVRTVLLDDDEHTYEYVIEMLQKLFVLSTEAAFRHAVEVDSMGKTIVITCEKPEAQFACVSPG